MPEIILTSNQIKLMKHCIRFESKKVKRMKYVAYRNHYCAGDADMEFEDLVAKKMAEKNVMQGKVYYFLTEGGLNFLSEIMGIKIIESD